AGAAHAGPLSGRDHPGPRLAAGRRDQPGAASRSGTGPVQINHTGKDLMRIAIVGGTGKEGSGLGARWATAGHDVMIGSRDAERARGKAAELAARVFSGKVTGMSNADAVRAADV